MSAKTNGNIAAPANGNSAKEAIKDLSGITGESNKKYFSIQNNYRFDALIRAIDFFSQKFNLETLMDYAAEFINEVLTLGSSALFVLSKDEQYFTVSKSLRYENNTSQIENSTPLQNTARLYGAIITKDFSKLFDDAFIKEYNPSIVIPLIHNGSLIGFIVSSGKAVGSFDDDDLNMANALMRLFNNSFERHFLLDEVNKTKKALDSTMFELYAVHKTSRVLFSEIELDKVLSTGTEIFSEVSGSSVTAFALIDEQTGNLTVKSYNDVITHEACPEGFFMETLENPEISGAKYIYDIKKEFGALAKIFKAPEKFDSLKAEHVILIIKEKIVGFVTLGKNASNGSFSSEILELVGSLAISCFIAINNAVMFTEMTNQKNDFEKRYNDLINKFK